MKRLDLVDGWMIVLVLTWGTAFPAIKALGAFWDPYQISWFRYLPFLPIYGVWLAVARRDRFRRVALRDWGWLLTAGFLGVVGYHFALNWGLQQTGGPDEVNAATGAILIATAPLWTLLIAAVVGQERFDGRKAFWSVVAFAGVMVVVFLGKGHGTEFTVARKALVILIAPLSWALYNIIAKPQIGKYGGMFVTGVTMVLGCLFILPLGIAYGVAPLLALDGAGWAWYLYLSIAATVAGYAIWNWALKHRSATEVTSFIYFIPVVATVGGWLLIDEAVTLWFLLGAALVMLGVVKVNEARLRNMPDAPEPAPEAG